MAQIRQHDVDVMRCQLGETSHSFNLFEMMAVKRVHLHSLPHDLQVHNLTINQADNSKSAVIHCRTRSDVRHV